MSISLMWMVIAGVIAGTAAKLMMRGEGFSGLFVLGIGGSMIAGLIQYSEGYAIGLLTPLLGATVLLAVYGLAVRRPVVEVEKVDRDDFRKAA